ncbi:MAG: thioredoxin reductase [Candidatus Westeberhardia cardiocondylae]|nr:thioredoxin reductase [Candidatus Westeberhardia cardiocondylae]
MIHVQNFSNIKYSKLIILGSGPSGYTASIYAARANLQPTLITGLNPGGQLMNTTKIENWPGAPNQLTGPILMKRMYNHAKKFKVNIIHDHIIQVNLQNKPFNLQSQDTKYICDALIITTGSSPKFLGLPNEKNYQGKGISTCAVCDGFFYKNKEIAIVGGGNTALEEALYLSKIAKKVHIIHRRNTFKAEKILIKKIMHKTKYHNIILHLNYTIQEIQHNTKEVTGLYIQNNHTKTYEYLNTPGLFVAIGYNPNTSLFLNQLDLHKNYILCKKKSNNFTETSISGVFAAGDVIDNHYRQAITAAGTGCMAALDAEKYLNNKYIE